MTEHIRLYDDQWRLIWDSETATTPAYPHISTSVNAVIDYGMGWKNRWSGRFYRCPEGIKRELQYEILNRLTNWSNPFLEES